MFSLIAFAKSPPYTKSKGKFITFISIIQRKLIIF